MDTASILVIILIGGLVALLAWFEINSRRNDVQCKTSTLLQTNPETLPKQVLGRHAGRQKSA